MLYVCNAFSLSMLDREAQLGTPVGYCPTTGDLIGKAARVPRPISTPQEIIADFLAHGQEVVSAVGHADTAAVFATILGTPVPFSRMSVKLTDADHALIGQLAGPRLPEGVTTLPEGATIEWWII